MPDIETSSTGVIIHRGVKMSIDINEKRIPLENVQELKIDARYMMDDVPFLGNPMIQHFPTYGTLEGSMTIHETNRVWFDLVKHHRETGTFPEANFTYQLPPGSALSPSPTVASRSMYTAGKESLDFTLYGVSFTRITLANASTTTEGYLFVGDIEFVANDITFTNKLAGYDFSGLFRKA